MFSQIKDTIPISKTEKEYVLLQEGDTVVIELNEVKILKKNKFNEPKDVHYYYWLRKKVFKTYPYAQIASTRLDTINIRLDRIQSKSKRRRYIKMAQQYLEGEFTDQLKKMTKTEGRILIKLIHRQTGQTAFNQIKELKSGWKAFWYNSTANIFGLSLKTEYHPETVNEDFLIEDILQRAFIEEKLTEQPSKLHFDYVKIHENNKGVINVEEYKEMFAKWRKKGKSKNKS